MARELYDVLVIGGCAAGLTAAIYARRKELTVAVISPETGGATALSNWIENYPGSPPMAGLKLMEQFRTSAQQLGTEVVLSRVTAIETGETFTLTLDDRTWRRGRTLIVTSGKIPRRLNVPGENRFFGRGVSTCATCDGPLFKGKVVAVVGGGNAAVEAALELGAIARHVSLIHRRDRFRADEVTVAKLQRTGVERILNSEVIAVMGKPHLTGVRGRHAGGKVTTLPLQGVFLEIGADTDAALLSPVFAHNAQNEIIVDDRQRTSVRGAFAAGDVTNVAFKQTVISAGDGATAALEAHRFLTLPGYQWLPPAGQLLNVPIRPKKGGI